jgi:competence protein ComEC
MRTTAPTGESVWRSPLLPPALAVTAGVVADRCLELPFVIELLTAAGFLVAAVIAARRRLGLVYLLAALAALGAGYHQWRCRLVRADEVGLLAQREAQPARLRGVVAEGPRRLRAPVSGRRVLHSQPPTATASALVEVTHLIEPGGQRELSGTVRLVVSGKPGESERTLLAGLQAGDEVEISGRLVRIEGPGNPAGFDQSSFWAGQNVRALMRVRPDGVRRLREGWRTSPAAWFAIARDWCHDAFHEQFKDDSMEGLARALILGEGAPMTNDDWSKYVRTGVVHVLAISGQHLVVVAWVVWLVLFRIGVRQRYAAVFVALLLLSYALLTGGRPPALRAAVVCCAFCGAIVLRRPTLPANLFALGWLVVLAVNPARPAASCRFWPSPCCRGASHVSSPRRHPIRWMNSSTRPAPPGCAPCGPSLRTSSRPMRSTSSCGSRSPRWRRITPA